MVVRGAWLVLLLLVPAVSACTAERPCNVVVTVEEDGQFWVESDDSTEFTAQEGAHLRFLARNYDERNHTLRIEAVDIEMVLEPGPSVLSPVVVPPVGEHEILDVTTGQTGKLIIVAKPIPPAPPAASPTDPGGSSEAGKREIPVGAPFVPLLLGMWLRRRL